MDKRQVKLMSNWGFWTFDSGVVRDSVRSGYDAEPLCNSN